MLKQQLDKRDPKLCSSPSPRTISKLINSINYPKSLTNPKNNHKALTGSKGPKNAIAVLIWASLKNLVH
jgi:hypothetical protein